VAAHLKLEITLVAALPFGRRLFSGMDKDFVLLQNIHIGFGAFSFRVKRTKL